MTLGLKCIGPSRAHNYLVHKFRPQDAVVTLDNVRVGTFLDREGKRRSKIGRRCFHCFTKYDFDLQIKRHRILAGTMSRASPGRNVLSLYFEVQILRETSILVEAARGPTSQKDNGGASASDETGSEGAWVAKPGMKDLLLCSSQSVKAEPRHRDCDFLISSSMRGQSSKFGLCDANGVVTMDSRTTYANQASRPAALEPRTRTNELR